MIRADLHVHTNYSNDCSMSLESIIKRCLEIGVNCLAVTDHNTIAGALEMQKIAPFPVIVGEEVLTLSGEVIGLFLTKEIPRGLPADVTMSQIKAQGGLVCIPHPFDRLRRSLLKHSNPEGLITQIDIVEVYNSRTTLRCNCSKSHLLAQKYGLLRSAGSDAHTLGEIGAAYVEMPEFHSPQEFQAALAQGRIVGRRTRPWAHIFSSLVEWKKRLKWVNKNV